MANFLNFTIDSTEKEFNETLKEFLKWNKRQPSEICNAKAYFVALQAMRLTKAKDKVELANELNAPSKKYPTVPLACILVNKRLKSKGLRGLSGKKMADAQQKFVKRAQSHTQFLRSGWLPAIKTLDYYNKRGDISFVRRHAPKKPPGLRQFGKAKGSAVYAKPDRDKTFAIISNAVGQGKQDSPTVHPLILEGLKKGIAMENASMRTYIYRKYFEQFDKMKRKGRM